MRFLLFFSKIFDFFGKTFGFQRFTNQKKEARFGIETGFRGILHAFSLKYGGCLFGIFAFVFLQLFLQRIDGDIGRFLETLALLAGKEVVAAQDETDVCYLVFGCVGVVEFQRNLGVDDFAVL